MTVVDHSVDDALEAVGELCREVFGDLDVEASRSPSYSNEAVSDEHDRRLWGILADTGLLAAVLPESVGGGGTGVPGMVRLLTDAGAALARLPLVETFVAASVIGEKNLPAVLSGELVITAALAEHPSTIAVPLRLTGHRLNGITQLVPYPLSADLVLVPARREDGKEVLALVSLSTARIGDQVTTTGEPLGVLEFIDAEVMEVCEAVDEARALAALFSSAMLCGIAARALAMTAEYVSSRVQFGYPLATFQAVALRAADRYIDSRAMQAALWEAVRAVTENDICSPGARYAVVTAKIWAADGARRVVGSAQHLHGGFGVDVTYPLHRYHAWARYWELYGGSAEAWSGDLGELIAAHPLEEDDA
ncbi:acyl-CoA dehydrogenase family protein [Catenulispora pinisilvae]|uniref:acyl-CoA dehydrogenase family protein n=1 Tax=Catenulispora pinisilvae TaxID=2705253 RepID=UPI0018921D0B|nr:acyl-CoA dehydrogenase family protein [Catenulispora pinisilvae]